MWTGNKYDWQIDKQKSIWSPVLALNYHLTQKLKLLGNRLAIFIGIHTFNVNIHVYYENGNPCSHNVVPTNN